VGLCSQLASSIFSRSQPDPTSGTAVPGGSHSSAHRAASNYSFKGNQNRTDFAPLNSGVRRNHFASFRQHLYSPQSDLLNRQRSLVCTPRFIAAADSARTVRCIPGQVGSPGRQRQLRSRRPNLCRNSASTKHLACLQPGGAQGAGASHFCSVRSRGLSNYSFKGNQNRTDSAPLNSGVRRKDSEQKHSGVLLASRSRLAPEFSAQLRLTATGRPQTRSGKHVPTAWRCIVLSRALTGHGPVN
jgi:hypothetical protein